jgi:hypothetical protein
VDGAPGSGDRIGRDGWCRTPGRGAPGRLARVLRTRPFEKGDDSLFEKVQVLYNRAKHIDGAIAAGKVPKGATSPIWLTNVAMEGTGGRLSFEEFAMVLRYLGRVAEEAATLSPEPAGGPSNPEVGRTR